MASQIIYIPDLIGEVVDRVSAVFEALETNPFEVFFDWGHHEEVQRQLIYKEQNPEKPKKYPLIWLVTPFDEQRGGMAGLYAKAKLHLVLAHDSERTYTMEERRDHVFKPILYPVYAELMRQLWKHRVLQSQYEPAHTKRDIQYARVDKEGKNLFNDFVDVIDITELDIQVKNICL